LKEYLQKNGFQLLYANQRDSHYEIDLIGVRKMCCILLKQKAGAVRLIDCFADLFL